MFQYAVPVWLCGRENEMNLAAVFTATVGELRGTALHIAASTFYRLFVNGRFAAFGPARTAKGYARVDVLPLDAYDSGTGRNELRVEVVAYNCRSLSTCIAEGFLCAELRRGEAVLAYTGRDFSARVFDEKVQRVERYSVQRHFGEVWDLTQQPGGTVSVAPIEQTPIFLPRVVPYPRYADVVAPVACLCGSFADSGVEPKRVNRYSWREIPEHWGRFVEQEIPHKPFRWMLRQTKTLCARDVALPLTLGRGEYAVFDLGQIECGFLQFAGRAEGETDLVIGFSEYFAGDSFAFSSINCQNVIEYILPDGACGEQISFEPYTARFAMVMVKRGSLALTSFGIKTFERDMSSVPVPTFPTATQENIYRAALRTFAHNAVDLYSDCPSRERAGWLCDSYFTAIAEHHFFGAVPVEDAFLENHRLCNDPVLPRGMLSMCYPADVKLEENGMGHHIPQWCMWYVLEVREYLTERNPGVDPALFRASVEGVIGYLARFENSDGLLEDLPSWNFVEWSDANSWTKNVNYPTNFLYAEVLRAADALYGCRAWREKAERVCARAAALSFDGELFTDNAVRDEAGVLVNTGNTSEAGQYYALLFGGIDLEDPKYSAYAAHVRTGCRAVPETGRRFVPVNAFIGLYLRIKSLLKLGWYAQLLEEVEGFFGGMADRTGTLWEYREGKGSLDHGFASYAAYAMCVALERIGQV